MKILMVTLDSLSPLHRAKFPRREYLVQSILRQHRMGFIAGTLICLSLFFFEKPCPGQWSFTVVDSKFKGVTTSESLALDPAGNPHIAYLSSDQDTLWYAHETEDGWDIQEVDTGIDSDLSGKISDVSIDVDDSGRPHISYNADTDHWNEDRTYSHSTHHLKYATLNNGTWDIQFVKRDAESVEWNSLAVDSDGYPHISYYYDYELPEYPWKVYMLLYVRWTGSEWVEETINESNDELGQYCSMVLDSAGNPHVAYFWEEYSGPYNPHLRYAVRGQSGWVSESVNNEKSWYIHLALGPDGSPHIAYYNIDDRNLNYATKAAGGIWNISTVDDEVGVTFQPTIAVDKDGNPHLAYFAGPSNLVYAKWTGESWLKTTLDDSGTSHTGSLALKGGLEPRIAYYHIESSLAQLKYAAVDSDQNGLFGNASDLGSGWNWIEWLGFFNMTYYPWISHNEHGWMYCVGEADLSIFFWTMDMGWLWTGEDTYPHLYRFVDGAWIWYLLNSATPRWFLNFSTNEWEEH